MEGRTNILIAGLRLYPLPDNCVLEYDDEQGGRRVMLLSDAYAEIAALQRAWREPGAAWFSRGQVDIQALRWMDTHRPVCMPMKPLKTNPEARDYDRRSTYYLGWDFGAKQSVIREYKT